MGTKLKPIAQAYERCAEARHFLGRNSRCMEVIEDRAGILVERYVTNRGLSLILYATPSWWDVFQTVEAGHVVADTLARLEELCSTSTTA